MKNESEDDLEQVLQNMASEFGPRQPREGEEHSDPLPPLPPPNREVAPEVSSPVRLSQRRGLRLPSGRPVAVWVLLAVNIVMYVLTVALTITLTPGQGWLTPSPAVLQLLGWKEDTLIFQGQYWRFLSAMFLHGSIIHILFNGYALYVLGPEAERIYGTARFVVIYFLSGLAGGAASYYFSASSSVGASGAIFGLFGALLAFYYVARNVLGDVSRRQLQSMVGIILINLLIGFSANGVIDNYAHLGGLAGGLVTGWLLAPRYTIDLSFGQPALRRSFVQAGWPGVVAVAIALGALVRLVPSPFV